MLDNFFGILLLILEVQRSITFQECESVFDVSISVMAIVATFIGASISIASGVLAALVKQRHFHSFLPLVLSLMQRYQQERQLYSASAPSP